MQNEIKGMETWFSRDACFDSLGFSAKYGSYSLMAQLSKKVVTTKLVHVSEDVRKKDLFDAVMS